MAKKAYIGVGGVARAVKKHCIGVGGVAREVRNGYIGVGGVARQFFQRILHVYNAGDLCTDLSGGWTSVKGNDVWSNDTTGYSGFAATMSQESDYLYVYLKDQEKVVNANYNNLVSWRTTGKVALDGYSKLTAVCDIQLGSTYASMTSSNSIDCACLSASPTVYAADTGAQQKYLNFLNWSSDGENIITVDISGLSGAYYIMLCVRRSYINLTNNGDESITVKIKEIYLS